jgi:alpha-N-arabinofuranosidase
MKRVDPGIRLVFNGSVFPLEGTVEERDWNRAVLEAYLEEADFLSAHFYIGSCGSSRNVYRIDPADLRAIHHRVQDAAALVQDVADVLRADFLLANRRRDMARSIGIAFDEYNPWRRNRPGDTLDRFFDHTDALAVAEMFGIFVRNADVFRICCMAQLVNVLPAMSCRSGTADFVRHGTSLVQEMFLENRGRMAVDAYVDSPRYRGYLDRPVPYVTCSATAGEDRIVLNLVNRHMDEAFDVDVQVAGRTVTGITGRRLVAEAPDAVNTFDRPDAIRIEPFDAEPGRPLRIEPLRAVVCEVSLAP